MNFSALIGCNLSCESVRKVLTTRQRYESCMLWSCVNDSWTQKGNSLTLGTGLLMCLFVFSKFEVPNRLILIWKFRVGQIIEPLMYLIYVYPKIYVWSENSGRPKRTADHLGSLKKSAWLFGGLRKLLDISSPVPKVKESPPLLDSLREFGYWIHSVSSHELYKLQKKKWQFDGVVKAFAAW